MDKNILIHVGPPKSGTSAIQKWLSENKNLMLAQGFYYPNHALDENGVSSGNVLNLFSSHSDNTLSIDVKKISSLLDDFNKSGCDTLLLSSEFFFSEIAVLNKVFPKALFVGYLRFPLDVAESSYNQGVKRHGETRALGVPAIPRLYQLESFESHIDVLGPERFILRPYHKDCFVNQSLICDFLHAIGVVLDAKVLERINDDFVNSSYTLEALELKRWLNQFDISPVQHQLDSFLQRDRYGKVYFSLISPSKFALYQKTFIENFIHFSRKYNVVNGERFILICSELKQKEFVRQEITDKDFTESFVRLIRMKPEMYIFFRDLFCRTSPTSIVKHPQRLYIVKKLLFGTLKFVYLKYILYRKFNRFVERISP